MNHPQPLQILLADDDEDDTFLFREALAQIPYEAELTTADNGTELMKKLMATETAPDIIFLDMNMPIKNGLECLTEIRSEDKFKETPIIILSTSVADNLLESAYQAGANLYIQKPTSFSSLTKMIQNCIVKISDFISKPVWDNFLIRNDNHK